MEDTSKDKDKAGFWIRFAAMWVDLVIIYAGLSGAEAILNRLNIYVPFEMTFLVCALLYYVVFMGWKAQTPGKMICGLSVVSITGQRLRTFQVLVRETVGKLISWIPIMVGFFWIGISRNKRGWHDYIAGTRVIRSPLARRRGNTVLALVLIANGLLIGEKAITVRFLYQDARRMSLPRNVKTRYAKRDPSSLIEVSSLGEKDQKQFADWLNRNGKDPIDFAVDAAKDHQVVIFGERHQVKDELIFLKTLIPELCRRARVTCIAMEVCKVENNEQMNRLVTSPEFDRALAMKLARDGPWGMCGSKEYWDVFETVWQLNKTIATEGKKVRVVGIDTKWDGPSWALLGLGDEAQKGPPWERLRFARCGIDLLKLIMRDELMARNIEREIIEKEERGIVWVGKSHAFTHYRQPIVSREGVLVREVGRMAFMLFRKYGERIININFNEPDPSPSYGNFQGPEPLLGKFIESTMKLRGNAPVGFMLDESPFAVLRDRTSYYYYFQPRVALGDIASGYIFLKPQKEIAQCTWLDGYVSKEMFMKNKPFYEAYIGHKLSNANELNKIFVDKFNR
jgi:uncharacterized RDD family membrane protein YckC